MLIKPDFNDLQCIDESICIQCIIDKILNQLPFEHIANTIFIVFVKFLFFDSLFLPVDIQK